MGIWWSSNGRGGREVVENCTLKAAACMWDGRAMPLAAKASTKRSAAPASSKLSRVKNVAVEPLASRLCRCTSACQNRAQEKSIRVEPNNERRNACCSVLAGRGSPYGNGDVDVGQALRGAAELIIL